MPLNPSIHTIIKAVYGHSVDFSITSLHLTVLRSYSLSLKKSKECNLILLSSKTLFEFTR